MTDQTSSRSVAPAAPSCSDRSPAAAAPIPSEPEDGEHQFADAFGFEEPNPAKSVGEWLAGGGADDDTPRGCALGGPKCSSLPDRKSETPLPTAPATTPANSLPHSIELAELNTLLQNGHSSHYAFGKATQVAVPGHMVLLDSLTVLTGPATGQLTPYRSQVKIINNPVPLLVASIWLANVKQPHGRRMHIVLLNTQSHAATAVSPTELVENQQLQLPVKPSDAAFIAQEKAEAELIADEKAKAASRQQHGPAAPPACHSLRPLPTPPAVRCLLCCCDCKWHSHCCSALQASSAGTLYCTATVSVGAFLSNSFTHLTQLSNCHLSTCTLTRIRALQMTLARNRRAPLAASTSDLRVALAANT